MSGENPTFNQRNLSFLLGLITIGSIIFSIWMAVSKPQTDLDKREATNQEEAKGKAEILAQQLQWETEANAKKFSEMQNGIKDSATLAQNHIHTIDTRLETFISLQNQKNEQFSGSLIKILTILEERLPAKK